MKGKKLRIVVPKKPGFNEFLKVQTDNQTNETKVSGYYKEVFDAVMHALPYEFVPYPFIKPNGSRSRSYNDLVFQVSLQASSFSGYVSSCFSNFFGYGLVYLTFLMMTERLLWCSWRYHHYC